jgi:hypothetical protein
MSLFKGAFKLASALAVLSITACGDVPVTKAETSIAEKLRISVTQNNGIR